MTTSNLLSAAALLLALVLAARSFTRAFSCIRFLLLRWSVVQLVILCAHLQQAGPSGFALLSLMTVLIAYIGLQWSDTPKPLRMLFSIAFCGWGVSVSLSGF